MRERLLRPLPRRELLLFVQVFAVEPLFDHHYPALLSLSADPKEHQREPTGILALSCLFVVRGRFGRVLNRRHNRDCGPEEN